MKKRCPTCGEALPQNGPCESKTCQLVSAVLLTGDDPPAPVQDLPDDGWDAVERSLSPATMDLVNEKVPPPAAELPNPLPSPLEDPLRVLGWFLLASLTLMVAYGVLLVIRLEVPPENDPAFVNEISFLVVGAWFLFAIWRVLPHRRTDILYLRSFRHDEDTARIRVDLIRGFGPRVRVSGIRDPRRRSIPWLRQLNSLVFAFRYASPKYLNLEAGDSNWKARLWRSLTLARGAVLDVSDLTSYVKDEVRMCYRTLGLDRILFVGNGSKTVDQWRAIVAAVLDLPADAPIRISLWTGERRSRREFRKEVTAFAKQLPKRPSKLSPAGSEIAYQGSVLAGSIDEGLTSSWVEVFVGGILASLITSIAAFLFKLGGLGIVVGLVGLWLAFVQVRAFFAYLIECGTAREFFLTVCTMGTALLVLPVLAALPSVQKVRAAAARMSVSNNLKQISVAMHSYHDRNDILPQGISNREGKLLLSWRVQILPYVGERDLYAQFHLDEPWDSPHNLQLVEKMPKIYQHPSARRTPPGYTHYRVFVTPARSKGPSAIFRPRQPARISVIPDGTSNTILIAEAAEAVPWTKPDELEYAADKPLPKLGGQFQSVFLVAFADGSVRTLPTDLPEEVMRAMITADGGEILPSEYR